MHKNEPMVSQPNTSTMKFCQKCNNMLYSVTQTEGKAFLSCRSCDYKEEITKQNPVVYEHDLRQDTSVQHSINPYLKYDPTLPRFTNMVCPNSECPTKGKDSNIVGVKLDPVNVVWLYQCSECNNTWKQHARGT